MRCQGRATPLTVMALLVFSCNGLDLSTQMAGRPPP